MMAGKLHEFLQANQERILAELIEFARIPSVSTDPAHRDDISGAEWVGVNWQGRLKRSDPARRRASGCLRRMAGKGRHSHHSGVWTLRRSAA
jgi:hypothetical protein